MISNTLKIDFFTNIKASDLPLDNLKTVIFRSILIVNI